MTEYIDGIYPLIEVPIDHPKYTALVIANFGLSTQTVFEHGEVLEGCKKNQLLAPLEYEPVCVGMGPDGLWEELVSRYECSDWQLDRWALYLQHVDVALVSPEMSRKLYECPRLKARVGELRNKILTPVRITGGSEDVYLYHSRRFMRET